MCGILKRNWALGVTLTIAAVLLPHYWTALRSPAVGIYHDDSIYLITARALAEGRGYLIESLPDPIPQTKHPILFPALLSLIWKVAPSFPENTLLFKLLPLICAFFWFYLSYRLLHAESDSRIFSLTAVALVAASPNVVFLSTAVLSDTLFAALATLCLLLLRKQPSIFTTAVAALLASAAFHTRTIGFCLIVAGLACLACKRQFRLGALFGGLCAALAAPWLLWQFANRAVSDPYLSQASYYSGYNIVFNFDWGDKLRIATTNAVFLALSPQPLFQLKIGGWIGALGIPFFLRSLCKSRISTSVRLFAALSGIAILLWVWPPVRFLIPLLPVVLLMIWSAFPKRHSTWILILMWVLFFCGLWADQEFSSQARNSGFWYSAKVGDKEWNEFKSQLTWIKDHTPSTAIIQSNLDPTVFLFTGRHAVRGSHANANLEWYLNRSQALGTPGQFRDLLSRNKVSYLVATPSSWFIENHLFEELIEANLRSYPKEFQLVNEGSTPGYRIYRFAPSNLSPP